MAMGGGVGTGGSLFDGVTAFPNQGSIWYPMSVPRIMPARRLPGMEEVPPIELRERDLFTFDGVRVWQMTADARALERAAPLAGDLVSLTVQPRGWLREHTLSILPAGPG